MDLKTHNGLLTINNDIAAANNATVYLTSAGAGFTLIAAAKRTPRDPLSFPTRRSSDLNSTTNDVATLAASTSSGTLTYQDANALTVGTLAASDNGRAAVGTRTT